MVLVTIARHGFKRFLVPLLGAVALTAMAGSVAAAPQVFCERVVYNGALVPFVQTIGPLPFITAGQIPGIPGQRIHILEVGIGGDADVNSGPSRWRAHGPGVDFSWRAGQNITCQSADYNLAPTPPTIGGGRGFSYMPVNYVADDGATITVDLTNQCDVDGPYTDATDSQGNYYNDAGAGLASVRVWVLYEYVSSPVAVEGTTWGRVKALME
jgi:hypothetical protein